MRIPENYTYAPPDFERMVAEQRMRNVEELVVYLNYRRNGVFDGDAGRLVELARRLRELGIEIPEDDDGRAVRAWFVSYGKKLDEKLTSYCRNHGQSPEYVLRRLYEDRTLCELFAVDPQRQTTHQSYAADWISRNMFFVTGFRVLPSGRKNAMYVLEGTVRTGDKPSKNKSIDFYWTYPFKGRVLKFYATHKYTKQEGGAQDNQFADVLGFMENANKSNDEDARFFAVTDGDYYLEPTKRYGSGRLAFLRDQTVRRTFATNCEGLGPAILEAIEDWLTRSFSPEEIAEELSDVRKAKALFD